MNTISTFVRVRLCSGPILALIGCMNSAPIYDKHFGKAAHAVHAVQALNPNASMNNDPVSGVDGRATTSAMDRYDIQCRMPQSNANASVVNVSSGNSLGFIGK